MTYKLGDKPPMKLEKCCKCGADSRVTYHVPPDPGAYCWPCLKGMDTTVSALNRGFIAPPPGGTYIIAGEDGELYEIGGEA